MKKTTVLALAGGATAVAAGFMVGAAAVAKEEFERSQRDSAMGGVIRTLRDANATTDDEIVECALAYIRKQTEDINTHPAYEPVLKFGPAKVLWRTRRQISAAETVTMRLLREVFEDLDEKGYVLSDGAVRQITAGALALAKEYADTQDERNTAYVEAMLARLDRLDPVIKPVFNAMGDAIGQLGSLTEPVIRRIRKA